MSGVSKKELDANDQRLFKLAMTNLWPKAELHRHIALEIPVLLCNTLMFPWSMAMIRNNMSPAGCEDSASKMTYATLRKYFITMIKYIHMPTIVRTEKEAKASGLLMTGLQEQDRKRIEEYIGMDDHSRELEGVEIETAEGEKIMVAAHVYVWKVPMWQLKPRNWSPTAFLRGEYDDLDNGESVHCGISSSISR